MGKTKHGVDNAKLVQYVNLVRDNDDRDAFQKIVKALDVYLRHLATKKFFFVPGHSSDDVYQEGLYALSTKAIPDYCEEKGPFLGFAKLCIKRHIITLLKSANNNKNKALNAAHSLSTTAKEDDDEYEPFLLIQSNSENVADAFVRNEEHERMKALLLERLTPLEATVLELYLQNMSYMDIVVEMNKKLRGKNRVDTKVSDNALCRIKKKAQDIVEELKDGRI
jgi:RNA polymerase sporulation-specific sigma factor